MYFLLNMGIFRCYVSLLEGTCIQRFQSSTSQKKTPGSGKVWKNNFTLQNPSFDNLVTLMVVKVA